MCGQRYVNVEVLANIRDRGWVQLADRLESARIPALHAFLGFDIIVAIFVDSANKASMLKFRNQRTQKAINFRAVEQNRKKRKSNVMQRHIA
jgi:hypothetical protein